MKYSVYSLILAVALVALLPVSSCTNAKSEGVSTLQESTPGIQYKVGKPQKSKLNTVVNCRGKIEVPPQSISAVHAPMGGFVKTIRFYPGDKVTKGTLLATVADQQYIDLQQTYLESKSKLNFLKQDLDRKQSLSDEKAVSEKEVQRATADFGQERERMQAIMARLKFAGIQPEQIDKSGIQPEVSLYAPITGYITQVNVHTGMYLTPAVVLYEIVDKHHLHLELEVFPKDYPKVKKGQPVLFRVPGDTHVYPAEVYLTGQMVEEQGTIKIHAHFEEETIPLPVMMLGEAAIQIGESEVWTVPLDAIVRQGSKVFVFVKTANGFEKTEVTVGEEDGESIQLLAINGQQPTAEIALSGAYYLNASAEDLGH